MPQRQHCHGQEKIASFRHGGLACAGYSPQDIPYNEFRDADATTCAAELLYEGEARMSSVCTTSLMNVGVVSGFAAV
jgi:hypothetical protein